MKASDHLSLYLEACMTTPEGRQLILADQKVRHELEKLPVDGQALMEALWRASTFVGGNVVPYLNNEAERRNFLQYFDGWTSTEEGTKRSMSAA